MTGMLFLMERHARKEATARAEKAKADRQKDRAAMREWVQNLPEEQKDAIYTGPVAIGGIVWMRVDGKDYFGQRAGGGRWLMDELPGLPDR